jgi:hypothetical protein
MAAATEPVDPATDPYLNGVFAPVDDGLDVADLPIIGKIPEDLRGSGEAAAARAARTARKLGFRLRAEAMSVQVPMKPMSGGIRHCEPKAKRSIGRRWRDLRVRTHSAARWGMDCFVAHAPRNDGAG